MLANQAAAPVPEKVSFDLSTPGGDVATLTVQTRQPSYQVVVDNPDAHGALTFSFNASPRGMTVSATGLVAWLPANADVDAFLRAVLAAGARVHSLTPRRESLEDLFVREAASQSQGAA